MAEEVKESTKEKSSVGRVLQIGGAVVGTLVGSGFASGQEVMQYFTAYGIPGSVGALCLPWCCSHLCAPPLRITAGSSRNRSTSPHSAITAASISARSWIFSRCCSASLSASSWTSGSGAMFEQYFGIPAVVGSTVMALIALGSAWLGLEKLTKVLGSTAPICIVFLVGVSLVTAAMNWGNLANADAMVAAADASGNVLRAVDFRLPCGSSLS